MADITSNLVAHWKLDETSGTTAADASGNGYDGTYVNSPTLGQAGAFGGSKAVAFATAGTQRMTAGPPSGSSGTLAFWFKPGTDETFTERFCHWSSSSVNRVEFVRVSAGAVHVNTQGQSHNAGASTFTPQVAVVVGTWIHLAVTWNAASLDFYANGTLIGTTAGDFTFATPFVAAGINQRVGGGYEGNATYDDVRIYSRALSAADVAALYAYTGFSLFILDDCE